MHQQPKKDRTRTIKKMNHDRIVFLKNFSRSFYDHICPLAAARLLEIDWGNLFDQQLPMSMQEASNRMAIPAVSVVSAVSGSVTPQSAY